LAEASLDAAMICVGVQYLQQPVAVMRDIARTMRPGAPLAVSFSNRCFPTKAVAVWLNLGPRDHARLVDLYLRAAGFADVQTHVLRDGRTSDPMTVVVGRT
jgi:ubiquinone/menaquinone biosynthesis C-methylase UbiE